MKLSRPSPATVISIVALVMATTGTAVAAVNYARNAGAVDGRSAVPASSTLKRASGQLVATASRGADAGRIPSKFISGVVPAKPFGKAFEVVDGAKGAAVELSDLYGFGRLTAACNDDDVNQVGQEDPSTTVAYGNSTGSPVNVARRAGGASASIIALLNGTQDSFPIRGSNTFIYHLERGGENVFVNGVVRQDGADTPAASCLVYGTVQLVRP